MDNKYYKWIKTYIIDVLPGITIATYVLGIVYNMSFYSVFGLDITQYLSLGEMFLGIVNILLSIIFMYLGMILYVVFVQKYYPYNLAELGGKLCERIICYVLGKGKDSLYSNNSTEEIKSEVSTGNEVTEESTKDVETDNTTEDVESENKKRFLRMNIRYLLFIASVFFFSLLLYVILNATSGRNFCGQSQSFMVIPFIVSTLFLLIPIPVIIGSVSSHKRSIMILETVAVFYLFAYVVISYSGRINGEYVRDYDKATFEIKLNDGSILNNNSYRYINQVNDRVFLLDKKTNENMILGNDGIMYMKIHMIPRNSK